MICVQFVCVTCVVFNHIDYCSRGDNVACVGCYSDFFFTLPETKTHLIYLLIEIKDCFNSVFLNNNFCDIFLLLLSDKLTVKNRFQQNDMPFFMFSKK